MTVIQRAATLAAMTLSLVGMTGMTTPSRATELAQSATQVTWGPSVPVVQQLPAPSAAVEASAVSHDFDSLSEAVSAQDESVSDASLRCLASAIYFETRGEPLSGQLAVAKVIINRTKSGRFPEDLCGVITQRGQFGFVRGGAIPSINTGSTAWHTSVAVAKVALADEWDTPAEKALFFNASGRAPGAGMTRIASIGNHFFYR